MIPVKEGYYWIKSLDYDGTGGKSISDWYIGYFEGGMSWLTVGTEVGMHANAVVEIGPEILQPE
jgi:hypothetical protein